MSKGSSNSCSLHNYFENSNKHRKFSETVKNLCVGYVFSPKKSPGITVLVPSDKLVSEIEHLSESSKPDDVSKARDIVKSLFLKANIKSTDDWLRYADDVPNFLNQKVPVTVAAGKVSVNGQAVTIDSSFHDSSEGQNLSVWLLQGDKGVGLTNPESKAKFSKVVRKDATKGSYEAYVYGSGESQSNGLRSKIIAEVENCAKSQGESAFIAYTADLLKYMKAKDEDGYKNKLLANVTLDSMADFYLLVDPYGMASTPMINDVSLKSWWTDAKSRDVSITGAAACKEIKSDLDDCCKSSERIGSAVEQARSDIESSNNLLKSVNRAYSTLASNNTICGVSGAYSKEYSDFMSKNTDWKMLSDQLKFGVAMKSAELGDSEDKVEVLSNMISEYMSNKGRGINRVCGLAKSEWGNLVGKDDDTHLFVNTDYFMSNSNRSHDVKGSHQAAKLLSSDIIDDVANVHQFLCEKNVKALTAQAKENHERLKNTLASLNV
jgi:hypothetical protein